VEKAAGPRPISGEVKILPQDAAIPRIIDGWTDCFIVENTQMRQDRLLPGAALRVLVCLEIGGLLGPPI
jgi:hypothetical protein